MTNQSRSIHNWLPLATLILGMTAGPGNALGQTTATTPFASDGWYTWRVDAVDDAGDWCCFSYNSGNVREAGCSLDNADRNYGISRNAEMPVQPHSGELQIYARFDGEAITQLRALSPWCGVESATPWNDLGKVTAVQSIGWLSDNVGSKRSLQDARLMAIAAHAGDESRQILVATARAPGNRQLREQAIFWMGQLRVVETRDELLELINSGDSQRIREQAIFSYAQSPADDRLDVLIAVIEDPNKAMQDRKQALFWLAQTDSAAGVDYIQKLVMGS